MYKNDGIKNIPGARDASDASRAPTCPRPPPSTPPPRSLSPPSSSVWLQFGRVEVVVVTWRCVVLVKVTINRKKDRNKNKIKIEITYQRLERHVDDASLGPFFVLLGSVSVVRAFVCGHSSSCWCRLPVLVVCW